TMKRKYERPAGLHKVLYIRVAHDRRLLAKFLGIPTDGGLELEINETMAPDFTNAFADYGNTVERVQYRRFEELARQLHIRVGPLGGRNIYAEIGQPIFIGEGSNRRPDGRITLREIKFIHWTPTDRYQDRDIIRDTGTLQ